MNKITPIFEPLLTVKNAAKYLSISERKLWSLTECGDIPAVKFGRCVRYDVADIDAFISKQKTTFQGARND